MCLQIPKSKKEIYTAAVFNNKPFLSAKKQLEQFIKIQKTPKVVFKFFKISKEEKTEMYTPFRLTTVKMDGDLLTCNGFFLLNSVIVGIYLLKEVFMLTSMRILQKKVIIMMI